MAASLSTTLFSNTLQCSKSKTTKITNPASTPVLSASGQSPNRTLNNHNSLKKTHFIASAMSSGSGFQSLAASEDLLELDTVKVFDLNGNETPISDLWKDRKAVVAFARHFGCVLCRKRADFLASKKARAFSEQTKFKGEVYADLNHSSYDALGFIYGVSTTFTPKAGLKIMQVYMEGYRQDWKLSFERDTMTKGGWQQGGIVVAGPGKHNISYIHKDKEAGDDPDIEDVLKACCS